MHAFYVKDLTFCVNYLEKYAFYHDFRIKNSIFLIKSCIFRKISSNLCKNDIKILYFHLEFKMVHSKNEESIGSNKKS